MKTANIYNKATKKELSILNQVINSLSTVMTYYFGVVLTLSVILNSLKVLPGLVDTAGAKSLRG